MRIRSRLLLLACAVLLPALVGAAIALAYVFREQQAFHRESMQETARALALALDRELARRESILRTLAGSVSLAEDNLERFHAHASSVAKELDVAIILSDLEGRQLVNTRIPYGRPLPRMLQAERDDRARLGNEVKIVSDVYLPPANLGPHSFAIQLPVRRDGRVVQFLTMGSFARQLQALLAGQRLPAGWHATIVDRRGVVAARSAEPEKYVGRPVRPELWETMAAQPEGEHEGRTLSGVAGTAYFSQAPESGWRFLVSVPQSVLQGLALRATLLLGAISLLLLGLGLAAALAVARRISGPVERLRGAAERLGHNEPVEARPTGTDELDAVARAMAGASERLRGATAELERRVAQAVAGFEQSQRALLQSQKLDALGRLTGGIAHDFNNVLQTLTAGLQVLKLRGGGADAETLAGCQRAVARGTELARQLMAFGRVQELRAETVDTGARLAEARHLLGGALPADLRLDFELEPGLWPVRVDPAQLELALLNLVINARDATPAGGKIAVRMRNEALAPGPGDLPPGDYVLFAVADSGHGMSEEVMARALDPFYTTKAVGQGSGMGLPQAYGFARQNGGTLALESVPGLGTTAKLWLPRSREPVRPPEAARPASAPRVAGGRVLLVEDDVEVRATMSSALREAGFEIDAAASADEALRRLEGGASYDAVLTDVVMPGKLSGVDLARLVRERHPRTGVVLATGYADRASGIPGVRALAKPYELQQAVDALDAAIRGADATME